MQNRGSSVRSLGGSGNLPCDLVCEAFETNFLRVCGLWPAFLAFAFRPALAFAFRQAFLAFIMGLARGRCMVMYSFVLRVFIYKHQLVRGSLRLSVNGEVERREGLVGMFSMSLSAGRRRGQQFDGRRAIPAPVSAELQI